MDLIDMMREGVTKKRDSFFCPILVLARFSL